MPETVVVKCQGCRPEPNDCDICEGLDELKDLHRRRLP